jgi:S-DNA-T family DNA segregation ATPase FtsK/SpoIIIE
MADTRMAATRFLPPRDVGDDEYGQSVTVPVIDGSHPLGAGATGSGKGSIMWGLLRQCGP